jgi:hypothetical protein
MTPVASSDAAAGSSTDKGPHPTTSPNIAATMTTAALSDKAAGSSTDKGPHPTTSPHIAATMTTAASSDKAAGSSTDKGPHPTTSPNVIATMTTAATSDAAAGRSTNGIVQCNASGADAESYINKQPSSSKADNTPSTWKALDDNDAYDVTLQKTIDGYMLQLTTIEASPPTPFIENYSAVFEGYKRHKGDISYKAEKDRVIYHKNGILLTVNGEDIGDRTLDNVTSWIRTLTEETITVSFLHRMHFNDLSHRYK